jgi:citrate synthase
MDGNGKRSWSTSVSDIEAADVFIRGYGLGDLIGRLSFSNAVFLLIRGRLPKPGEARMMDAILCSVLDYGLKKPGTVAARYCVSANPSMTAGLCHCDPVGRRVHAAPDDAGRFIVEAMPRRSAPVRRMPPRRVRKSTGCGPPAGACRVSAIRTSASPIRARRS